ncbi:MAG: hypothetical protein OXF88_17875 [Rhodobacteraceae bacterium]|nr:hypothetical protein [Paracoccaceae bacterium]MCY4141911.1 hypothetical protein [Paracoccaceae bacterium]
MAFNAFDIILITLNILEVHVVNVADICPNGIHGIASLDLEVRGINEEADDVRVHAFHDGIKMLSCLDKAVKMRVVCHPNAQRPGNATWFRKGGAEFVVVLFRMRLSSLRPASADHKELGSTPFEIARDCSNVIQPELPNIGLAKLGVM